MRKFIIFLFLFFICTGCSNQKTSTTEEYSIFGFHGISEKGIYHIVRNEIGNQIYFYDVEANQDVALCAKPNCDHKNESCDAVSLAVYKGKQMSNSPIYYNGDLYMFYEDRMTASSVLCKSSESGSNRKEIVELPEGIITSAMIYHDKLYVTFNLLNYDADGYAQGLSEIYHSYSIDLESKKVTEIDVSDKVAISFLGVDQQKIYLETIDFEDDTALEKSLYTIDDNNTDLSLYRKTAPGDNLFLYQGTMYFLNDHKIMKLEADTNTISEYMDLKNKEDNMRVSNDPNGLMTLTIINDQESVRYQFIDLSSGTIIPTEEIIVNKLGDSYIVEDQSGNYHLLMR